MPAVIQDLADTANDEDKARAAALMARHAVPTACAGDLEEGSEEDTPDLAQAALILFSLFAITACAKSATAKTR